MTVTGNSGGDDPTRLDREPPAFPPVGDPGNPAPQSMDDAPLFTPADDGVSAAAPAVAAEPVRRSGSTRLRWAVAGVATLLVVAVVGGVLLLTGPRVGTPSVVEYYVPADTAGYVEIRLDFPGDQRERLATFMSHFPGFADPAAFQRKVDETLDQMFRSSPAGVSWTNDIVPWFGGQVALFGQTVAPSAGTPPSVVVALTVKDRGRLEALLDQRLANIPVDSLDYGGRQIRSVTPSPGGERISFVTTDELVLIGTRIEDIQAALDVKAGTKPALAQDQFFLQQLAALHADRLATAYVDMARVADSSDQVPMPGMGLECLDAFGASSRVKYVAEVRAEGDHLAVTSRSQPPSGEGLPPTPVNAASVLTDAMPADSIAYFEARQVGASVRAVVSEFLECMATTSEAPFDLRSLEQFLGTSPEDYLDFVGDVGVAVTVDDELPGGGLIAMVDDEAVASQRVERLLGTIRALAAFGEGLTVEDVEHNGVTITVFSSADLPPGTPPMSLGVAVANGRLYMGVNDFVTGALDRTAADSLTGNEDLRKALTAGGAENTGLFFVDVARARELIERNLPDEERARYEAEAKPFIEPVTSASVVNRVDNGIVVSHVFLYVE